MEQTKAGVADGAESSEAIDGADDGAGEDSAFLEG